MSAPSQVYAATQLNHYKRLKQRFHKRDRINETIHEVRQGNIRQLFPSELNFSITFDGSPIANFVDIVAHDMAEGIAALPSLACASGQMKTDADLKRADTKNRIGDEYWRWSRLQLQMFKGADRYVTYGFLPFFVAPDTEGKCPYIFVEDPRKAYYELDRYGRTKVYSYQWKKSIDELVAMFPEHASAIRTDPKAPNRRSQQASDDTELDLIRWVDDKQVILMLPERDGLILDSYEHLMPRAPVWIAERPGEDDSPRGQFDDVIWVQVARSIMATLALEAASIAVQAPIAVPSDVDQLSIGPHAIMQADDAQAIHKVNLDLPTQIFAENASLDNELRVGSRYPEARSGGVNSSVITGKGVEALLGTFDSQIKGAQEVLREALQNITSFCFEMDEKWWPNESKTLTGTISGTSYETHYTPAADINGRYVCRVNYGFLTGMQPSQAYVTILQLEGAGLIARGTAQDNLPFQLDQIQEDKKINVQGFREALKQGLFAMVQGTGAMVAQGQDPLPLMKMVVQTIHQLQEGVTVEDAVEQGFEALAAAQQQAQQQAEEAQEQAQGAQGPEAGGAPPGQGGPPGGPGGPQGVAPGQAGLPPGGRPALEQLIAGFRGNGNLPVLQSQVRRQIPIGTG